MILTLAETDEYDLPDGSLSFLGQELFDGLLSFEPYRYRISYIAKGFDNTTIQCIICDIEAYSPDAEKCLACGFAGEIDLINCETCGKRSVFYDRLNAPYNLTVPGKCGACGAMCRAAHCPVCQIGYVASEVGGPECPFASRH